MFFSDRDSVQYHCSSPPVWVSLLTQPAFEANQQRSLRFIRRLGALRVLAAIALTVQSCSPVQVDACDRIKKSIYTTPQTVTASTVPIDRATAIYGSKRQAELADQLAEIPIEDSTLREKRDSLVKLYRHDSDLGMQISSFMSDGGEISVTQGNRTAYEQVAYQRIIIDQQVKIQVNSLYDYCGAE